MPASGPRSRGARVHPRPCQGCEPWPRSSAASGLVLATQKLGGITGRGTRLGLVPTRKQRRRREKERRHEYEYVYVDEEGREVEVEDPEQGPSKSKNGKG